MRPVREDGTLWGRVVKKKLAAVPAMGLPTDDRREFCKLHGWVGRRAFQRDRHDFCEAPPEDLPLDDVDVDDDDVEDAADAPEEERWSRASARRRGIPPKKTLAVRRITQVELAEGRAELLAIGADGPYDRPRTRGDCQWCPVCQLVRDGKSDGRDDEAQTALGSVPASTIKGRIACGHQRSEIVFRSRPCVFVACKHALFLDTSETGSIILNFPHLEPGQMPADRSCALDLSDRGSMTLEDIAVVTNLTRERIRQVEMKALIRRARPAAIELGLGPEDAAAISVRGPGADIEETSVEDSAPSDVASLLGGSGRDES